MKKSIVITLILALLISLTTAVSAVETRKVTPSIDLKDMVDQGEEFTVSISLKNAETNEPETAVMADFTLEYDPAVIEYVDGSANTSYVTKGDGSLTLQYFANASETFTLKFKAVGEKGAVSTMTFKPTELTTTGTVSLDSLSTFVYVTIKEDAKPSTGDTGTTTPADTPSDDNTQTPSDEVDDNEKDDQKAAQNEDENKKPTKIPQTGVNYIVVAGIVVAVAVVVGLVKKFND